MADKHNEKKPIDEVLENVQALCIDIKDIKTQVNHIKEYIRKEVIKKQLEEEETAKIEDEYVKPKSAWWW
jgi:hypothetical protein